ncbi:phosphotransferase [Paenibacillus xylanilyticus]|uniref:Phosphotransferase n=1 Tax=Paenibacillus xylanilyticus TaxID=248903 RepID=A0A7Y6C5D9_9BACL|nr:phosphotransferase [Paenibacillus xylanilyticus]NUU79849.1 phosphotransferase [Paenibacillus xylanilyticus]
MNCKFDEVIQHYFEDTEYTLRAVPFGLTNSTKVLEINGQRFVVRIYNRHIKTIEGIELESQVTALLAGAHTSFQVPNFLNTREGEKYVVLRDGSLAAITTFLEGKLPQLSDLERAKKFGSLVGEFSSEISVFPMEKNVYRGTSFTKMYEIHPLANRQSIRAFFASIPFEISEELFTFYQTMITDMENSNLDLEVLPQQFVHHDLLIYNLLAQLDEITGVLDFDFIGMDAAFMEVVISFNHMIQESGGSLEMMEAFLQGYSVKRKHSALEISYLPLLTQIYFIAVLHFYIGQYYAGATIEYNFAYMLNQFERNMNWLEKHDSKVKQLLHKYLV